MNRDAIVKLIEEQRPDKATEEALLAFYDCGYQQGKSENELSFLCKIMEIVTKTDTPESRLIAENILREFKEAFSK